MYIKEVDVLRKHLDYIRITRTNMKEDTKPVDEAKAVLFKIENFIETYYAKSNYWEERYKRHKQEHNERLQKLAEDIKFEFYREFEELVPSIMEEKIDALVKEMVGGDNV